MNVLFAVSVWPNLYTTYLFHEVAWLVERGHRIIVVYFKREVPGNAADLRAFGLENIPAFQFAGSELGPVLDLVRREKVQIAYAHSARDAAELALRLHRAIGLPYTLRLHGGDVHSHPSPFIGEMFQHASALCPVSQFLADLLLRKRPAAELPPGLPLETYPEKIHVCPNGIPATAVADGAVEQSDARPVIGTIGRLTPMKRQRDLLEAVAMLAPSFPGVSVRLIGGGELEGELDLYARQLGIAERTRISGPKSWHETLRLASELSIYVQPSEKEGFCLATVEAASQGLPLVLSRTGVHEECVVPGVNGHLFNAGDVGELSRHLRSLLSAGGRARTEMGAASLDMVKRKFLLETTMRRIEAVLHSTPKQTPPVAMNFS